MFVEDLGRPAHFFIPSSQWNEVKEQVHTFLIENYDGYTIRGPYTGNWRPQIGSYPITDSVYEIKVSFKGKERIPKLQEFLAELCWKMGEKCLYLETGEDSWLIYP